ncbi:MAG: glycosyltransferase family 4 protein [Phycisphaerae bacterium]|nr:glycosyltransferase family 4 protein [Phycisphaerae bacterium]
MRRILYLSRGGQTGGSQRQLAYLLDGLDRGRWGPVVVCREDGPFVEQLRSGDVETHVMRLSPWRKWRAGLGRFGDCWRLAQLAQRAGVALVHCSDLWLSGYMRHVAKRLGVPSVLHVRAPKPPGELRKHRCRSATAVIAISRRVGGQLTAAGVAPERITVMYDAVDLERFAFAERDGQRDEADSVLRRAFPQARGVLVGLVGRIDPAKRQEDFLRAAGEAMRDARGQATFFLIGPAYRPSYAAALRAFARRDGLDGRVIFTGVRNDMPAVLGSLDVLVSLSGGSVMMEAMACGAAVVSAGFTPAADSEIVRDGETGLLLPPGREFELGATLRRVIGDAALRRRLARSGRRHAETHYGADRLVAATQAIYERLLDEG